MSDSSETLWKELETQRGGAIAPRQREDLMADRHFAACVRSWALPDSPNARQRALINLATLVDHYMAGGGGVHRGPGADSATWRATSELVFEILRPLQRAIMAALELQRPVAVQYVEEFLTARSARESRQGDRAFLCYPAGESGGAPATRWMLVFKGYTNAAWWDLIEEHPADDELQRDWIAARRQTLFSVAEAQDAISEATGVSKLDAVLFLLCDVVPVLPYVDVSAPYAGFKGRHRGTQTDLVHITIGDPSVTPDDVREAYRTFRDTRYGDGRMVTSPKSRWPQKAEAFVRRYRAEHGERVSWSEMHEAWRVAYPEAYQTLASFKNTVNRRLRLTRSPSRARANDQTSQPTNRGERSPRRQGGTT